MSNFAFINLIERNELSGNAKATEKYQQLSFLLQELSDRSLSDDTIEKINKDIEQLNAISSNDRRLQRTLKSKETAIIRLVENRHKIVPRKYYQRLWMILGMSAIGMPIGFIFAKSVGNLGLIGIGFPFGMLIGSRIGIQMDKKALREGRQLQYESK